MIKKILAIVLTALALMLVLSVLYSLFQPRPFKWDVTLQRLSKQPYGGYILHRELPHFFPGQRVRKLNEDDLKGYLDRATIGYLTDSLDEKGEYVLPADSLGFLKELPGAPQFNILLTNRFLMLTDRSVAPFLQHIYQGNKALIVAENSSHLLWRLLGLEMQAVEFKKKAQSDSLLYYQLQFAGSDTVIQFKPFRYANYFSKYPPQAKVLVRNGAGKAVGVEIPVGKGSILLFSMPIILSNYYLLENDPGFAEKLLTWLPNRTTYYAQGIDVYQPVYDEHPGLLSYVHSQPPLAWAFYTLLVGVLLFFVLQLRRVERPVPVIEPPRNLSLDFIRQVSALFFMHRDNKSLVKRKMDYFLDQVRNHYHLPTGQLDERFFELLAHKTGVKRAFLQHIFRLYNQYMSQPDVTDEEFIRFSKLMQTFKHTN